MSVALAMRQPCDTCKAKPGKPCEDVKGIAKPSFDGVHVKRMHRALYAGRKMISTWRVRHPDEAREIVMPRSKESKETLEEVMERAVLSWRNTRARSA